jgi:hypothetical protein
MDTIQRIHWLDRLAGSVTRKIRCLRPVAGGGQIVRVWMLLVAALVPGAVQGQPEWSVEHGFNAPATTARGNYYNNQIFGQLFAFRDDPTIDFFWSGAPMPGMFENQFSVRWTGRIVPRVTDQYVFRARSDDGVRVYLNGELIIDEWRDQAAANFDSAPRLLAAGSVYNIRVDFYDSVSVAEIRLYWRRLNGAFEVVTFQDAADGTESYFGMALAALGEGKVVASAPRADLSSGFQVVTHYHDAGLARIYDGSGQSVGFGSAPLNNLRRNYGNALAAFGDGRFLASAAVSATHPGGTATHVGAVYLQGGAGELLATWPNPDGATNQGGYFGHTLAALPGNRFAASSLASPGKVYLFDASVVGLPLVVLSNSAPDSALGSARPEAPWVGSFGSALSALSTNRLLVGYPRHSVLNDRAGSVFIYDLEGNLIRPIHNPTGQQDLFGATVVAVDAERFLIGAPEKDETYVVGESFTNSVAGAVYLYNQVGNRLATFVAPDIARSGRFGTSIAMLGLDRVLIGSPDEKVGNILDAGAVHLFNLDGVHLGTYRHPTPAFGDDFGAAVAAIDAENFVVGAPGDDTARIDGGSIHAFVAPVSELALGDELEPPANLNNTGQFPTQGPTVTPVGAAYWHAQSGKLFAVKPGRILVSWPTTDALPYNVDVTAGWPADPERYQIHVAGPTAVELSAGGTFTETLLQATTTDADPGTVATTKVFAPTTTGLSLLMVSAGPAASNPIRFQFVRTIRWDDPGHLHDDVPAIIGQPITDPADYHDPIHGPPQVILPGGVFAPAPVFDRATRTGTIIPVNRENPANADDDLVVAFYQTGTKLYDPVTGMAMANAIGWPHQPVRFLPEWPANPPKITIASQQGTGAIDPAEFVEWDLYVQNSAGQAGFNPNDEHALRRPFGAGEAVFALRDDLGSATTSEPYVLIRYRDPTDGLAWRMKVWRVVAEEAPYFFEYPAVAGSLIQAPLPLSTLAVAPQTTGVSGPYWRDRKQFFWARAAGDDGGTAEIVMGYFYPVQSNFFFPGANPPAVGSNVPWLDARAGTPGTPIDIRYETIWPEDAPELRVGETLVRPKSGLPDIDGQSSVEILYEQSLPQSDRSSVRLIDPIQMRTAPLAQLPGTIETRNRAGNFYFPTLPPYLEGRVSYDPVGRLLRLAGEFVEPPAGESYLLLNVLTPRDRAVLAGLATDAAWQTAVNTLAVQAADLIDVAPESAGFDGLALTAGDAQGVGYVTLAFGNSTILSAPSEPISLSVIKVTCPLYRGELKVVESPNPLAEQLTLRHSGDFSGRPDDFEFEWRTLPPVDGLPSTLPPAQWGTFQPSPATGVGAVDITIAGPGLYTLSDNYFVCRYRRVSGTVTCGPDWSDWTAPMLAEGWIKRVLAGIGPFEQRIQDYQDTEVNTIVSMISQAGARAVGDVALNLDAVNEAGLIEVYETVLRRGMGLSIEGAPPVDYPPANDALLLAAGRLADLYMLVGNEAYADAVDPTIAFGTDHGVYGAQATSLHCFMNQTASLLEEELALLRGRDNSKLPSIQTHPVYNRLIWNFTRDITGGEVAYALNYNIRNMNGDVAGAIDEADASQLYPQGHGDAWGHYLTAIKNYYRLLRNPNFTWVPRIEAVIVGGVPVSVDYLDERKFAAAAVARAKAGSDIVNLTFRDGYVENPAKPWQAPADGNATRAWGGGEWASRAGQGALFDWVVANAMLPDVDPNPGHTGIQKIERATMRELPEIAEAFRQIQEQSDQADGGRNPLGLANNVVPFDIDPGAIAGGKTHFDQINERANEALKNAVAVFDHANASTQLLRRQADDSNSFQQRVVDTEADFNNRLIEIFGTPYTDDMGPTGTYPTGYPGPDIYHYDYADDPELAGPISGSQPTLQFRLSEMVVTSSGGLAQFNRPVTFHFSPRGFGLSKPASWTGQRVAPGEIQMARSALYEAIRRLERGVTEYENLIIHIEDEVALLRAFVDMNAEQAQVRNAHLGVINDLNKMIFVSRGVALASRFLARQTELVGSSLVESLPKVVGMATDALAAQRGILSLSYRQNAVQFSTVADLAESGIASQQETKGALAIATEIQLSTLQTDFAEFERLVRLEQLVRSEAPARVELAALEQSVNQASARYQAAVARGLRLLEERTRFRQQTAAQIQSHRYKDMAFRLFRSDALQKYRAQFDLAARYAYLAAKAYDYETSLAPGDSRGPGSAFLGSIIRSRSLGRFSNGVPLPGGGTGDPGLADPLARMTANWNLVLKSQLGFNNPQTETGRFSLRNELFRVLTGPGGSARWRETLSAHVVPNILALPEFQRHCIPFSPRQATEPAIVIPFATTINFGLNFFGWPAGGGDNDYDSTKFATKVRSVGVWFANYNNLGGGMINTPRVYLVPVGLDIMRAPTQGEPYVREWRILDQALPVPFPLSAGALTDPTWIPINDSLSEDFAAIRRFGQFRAYHDSGNFNPGETITDSRLIGRSVWNTRWLLIIPAGTLHTDRNEGIQRFINGALRTDGTRDGNGVSDIKIFFQTYAYSGS